MLCLTVVTGYALIHEASDHTEGCSGPPARRASTPLFGSTVGEEFTHAQLDAALELLLVAGAGVAEPDSHKYSVHSFRIFTPCALLAAGAPRWLIKRMLRWRGDESLEVYARVNDEDWARHGARALEQRVDSSIVPRLPPLEFTEGEQQRLLAVARAMLDVGAAAARPTTAGL